MSRAIMFFAPSAHVPVKYPKSSFQPPKAKIAHFPTFLHLGAASLPKINIRTFSTQIKLMQLKVIPKFTSPVLSSLMNFFGFKNVSKHPEGRLFALEHMEKHPDLKPGTVGGTVKGTLAQFVASLGPAKNALSGEIGKHYAQEAMPLLLRPATAQGLAATALFETNHWAHTPHFGSRMLGKSMTAFQRYKVLVNGAKAAAEGKTLSLPQLLLKRLTPEEVAAFKETKAAFLEVAKQHANDKGKISVETGLPALLKQVDALEIKAKGSGTFHVYK